MERTIENFIGLFDSLVQNEKMTIYSTEKFSFSVVTPLKFERMNYFSKGETMYKLFSSTPVFPFVIDRMVQELEQIGLRITVDKSKFT